MAIVGVKKVAQHFCVTTAWIQELVKRGMPKVGRGRYELLKCSRWYIRFLQKEVKERSGNIIPAGEPGSSLRSERERLLKAQADREELELERARHKIIPLEVYEADLDYVFTTIRDRMLDMPQRIAPELEGEDRIAIRTRLDLIVRSTLISIAARFNGNGIDLIRNNGSTPSSAGADEPAAPAARAAERQPVGPTKPSPT